MLIIKEIIHLAKEFGKFLICYLWLIKKSKKKNTIHVLSISSAIGDNCYGLTYLKAFKDNHVESRIVLIANKKYADLFYTYHYCYDDVIFVSPIKARRIASLYFNQYYRDKLLKLQKANLLINNYIMSYFTFDFLVATQMPFKPIEFIKTWLYHINDSSKISLPHVNDSKVRFKNKTIIFIPYANSTLVNVSWFTDFAKKAKVSIPDIDLFSNIHGNEQPIENTNELRCSLIDLYNLSRENCIIIGTRCGLMDFIVSSGVTIFPLLFENTFLHNSELSEWGFNAKDPILISNDNYNYSMDLLIQEVKKIYGN